MVQGPVGPVHEASHSSLACLTRLVTGLVYFFPAKSDPPAYLALAPSSSSILSKRAKTITSGLKQLTEPAVAKQQAGVAACGKLTCPCAIIIGNNPIIIR